MDEERLRDLLSEVTADCNDEDEAFWGLFYALAEDGLSFPLKAKALGDLVEVIDLDGASSSLRRGITALVRKGDREYPVGLADLAFVDPDSTSAEWLEVYRYWLERQG
jgi:hypothetical protein